MSICKFISNLFIKDIPKVRMYSPIDNTSSWNMDELELVLWINDMRRKDGLDALEIDQNLHIQARKRMYDCIIKGEISHKGFGETHKYLLKQGLSHTGENLAYKFNSARGCFIGWLNSDKHHENMKGKWKYIGVGIDKDDNGSYYYCALFGK